MAESLRQQYASISPGYHLNKNHWNTILIDGTLSELELCKMIDHSYELVFKGLRKSEKDVVNPSAIMDVLLFDFGFGTIRFYLNSVPTHLIILLLKF
ncbi:hypothetical protein LPB68_01840 [Paenibacillus crassostreae]|nr:hypothetical protein LPB68_01840 [Paenibacillus crassostreae]